MKKNSMLLVITLSLSLSLSGCGREGKGRVVSWDNVAISYDVQGKGEPALVFVHGWSCDKSYWRLQVPYFAKRYKVVTIDLDGTGDMFHDEIGEFQGRADGIFQFLPVAGYQLDPGIGSLHDCFDDVLDIGKPVSAGCLCLTHAVNGFTQPGQSVI